MTDPKANLIEKYLAGDANSDEVQRLNETLADNPHTADALVSEAYMDVQLRETLNGSALGAAIAKEIQPSKSVAERILSTGWMMPAMVLLAVSGWAAAMYVGGELGEARAKISALSRRVTEVEKDYVAPPVAVSEGDVAVRREAPEIHSMRGWLMTAPQEQGAATETHLLPVGMIAPLEQPLWTCPWGATEFRYESGVSISIERNTKVKFNEANGQRKVAVDHGIVHVTNLSKKDKRPTEIECEHATIRLILGQVAVQVDEHQTAVEAAVNQVEVVVHEDGGGRTFTVRRGQFLIVKPGEKTKVMQGMLKLGLESPDK